MKKIESLLIVCGYSKVNDYAFRKKFGKYYLFVELCKKNVNVIYDYYINLELLGRIDSEYDIDALKSAWNILDNDILYIEAEGERLEDDN